MTIEPFPVKYGDIANGFMRIHVKKKGGSSFLWDEDARLEIVEDLEFFSAIETIHSFGVPVFFKPTWQEVIAQIPPKMLDEVYAFEVRLTGFTKDRKNHKALTILFKKKEVK